MGVIPSFPSFAAGEIPTDAKLTSIKTAGDFWALTPRCGVYSNTPQAIPSGVTYSLFTGWDAELFDIAQAGDSEMHSLTTNPERIYIRTSGKYQISGQVFFQANPTGARKVAVRVNSGGSVSGGIGIFTASQGAVSDDDTAVPIVPLVRPFTAGDYLEMFVRQTSGSSLPVLIGPGVTFLQVKLDSV